MTDTSTMDGVPVAAGTLGRRGVLRAAVTAGAAAAGTALLGAAPAGAAPVGAAPAGTSGPLPYPDIADTSHASPRVARIMRGFFSAKSRHDPDTLMTYFARENVLYIDASSGNVWPSWDSLSAVFHAFLPNAPAGALSYPVRIVGDERSALVAFEDTPQLFGSELRILGSVTFDRFGKIVRWIDYWDGRGALRTNSIGSGYPTDFSDGVVNASPVVIGAATRLAAALGAGDAAAATALFSFDAVLEDMAAHGRVQGQLQIQRYLSRALPVVPYGAGSSLAHVVGGHLGGGYEWHASTTAAPMRRGNAAIELDGSGRVTRFTAIYDGSLLNYPAYQRLVMLAAEAPS